MINRCRKIESSPVFQNFIIVVILFAGVVVGLETYAEVKSNYASLLLFLDRVILFIFTVEIGIKFIARFPRMHTFFNDPWNTFDFIIVGACFIPFASQYAMVLRMLRLLRVLRLIRAIPRLQIVVEALLSSVPSMFYVSILLSILFYMYAVMGTFLFSINDPVHFANLQSSFLTLFRVVTLEDWTDIMYTQMYGCDVYGYGALEHLCQNPMQFPIIAPLYFVSFVLLGTMVFLNLFIGVIVNGMDEARKDQEKEIRTKIVQGTQRVNLEKRLLALEETMNQARDQFKEIQKVLNSKD